MKDFDAGHLCGALESLAGFYHALSTFSPGPLSQSNLVYDQSTIDKVLRDLGDVIEAGNITGMLVACDAAERITKLLNDSQVNLPEGSQIQNAAAYPQNVISDIKVALHELLLLAPRELSQQLVLVISRSKAKRYMEGNLFGDDVEVRFPSLSFDIREAGMCIAADRSTAAVFHLVRCLEGGIRAMSRCLGIPEPHRPADRTWGKLLQSLKEGIDAAWPNKGQRSSGDGKLFDEGYAALVGMKNPYRDPTMHLEKKYTEEEAESLFVIIRGLMRSLAARMNEDGDPKV